MPHGPTNHTTELVPVIRKPTRGCPTRITVCIEGLQRTGKTTLALTLPGRHTAYIGIDPGWEGVIEHYPEGKLLSRAIWDIPSGERYEAYEKIWMDISGMVRSIARDKSPKAPDGVIIDTGSDLYEILRYAEFLKEFGRVDKVQARYYGVINTQLRTLLRELFSSGKHVAIIHRVKETYRNDKPTGTYEADGFSGVNFLPQMVMQTGYSDGQMMATIKDCRFNMNLAGSVLVGPLLDLKVVWQELMVQP